MLGAAVEIDLAISFRLLLTGQISVSLFSPCWIPFGCSHCFVPFVSRCAFLEHCVPCLLVLCMSHTCDVSFTMCQITLRPSNSQHHYHSVWEWIVLPLLKIASFSVGVGARVPSAESAELNVRSIQELIPLYTFCTCDCRCLQRMITTGICIPRWSSMKLRPV